MQQIRYSYFDYKLYKILTDFFLFPVLVKTFFAFFLPAAGKLFLSALYFVLSLCNAEIYLFYLFSFVTRARSP